MLIGTDSMGEQILQKIWKTRLCLFFSGSCPDFAASGCFLFHFATPRRSVAPVAEALTQLGSDAESLTDSHHLFLARLLSAATLPLFHVVSAAVASSGSHHHS